MIVHMWKAYADTGSFAFEAYAPTKRQALAMLKQGWRQHRHATGAMWTADEFVEQCAVGYAKIPLSPCVLRDGELLIVL